MEQKINFSIIIPIYNEAASLLAVINRIKKAAKETGGEYEIIAINDGSSDNSAKVLQQINDLQIIEHKKNKGYGASLKTGIRNARYDWILIIDADSTYPPEVIPDLVRTAKDYDMVVGARVKKENAIPPERKHAKKFINWYAGYLAGKKIPDLNSGLRIFRKDIALKYWELFPERFSFTSTITMVCLTHGYEVKFLPIDYHTRTGQSSLKAKDFFVFLKLISKLSLFFKPIKVFAPLSLALLLAAALLPIFYLSGIVDTFYDTTFIVLVATALQTFFFGLLAEIVIHSK